MAAFVVLCTLGPAVAEDWPTYMHDNARSGVTTESLVLNEMDEAWVNRFRPLS